MIVKLLAIVCGILLTLLPFFMKASKKLKTILIIVGTAFIILSYKDLRDTSKLQSLSDAKIDSLDRSLKRANNKIDNIDNSIQKFGLKISGDSIIKINNTFVDNSSTNVKSENQKGGQTAGTITNY